MKYFVLLINVLSKYNILRLLFIAIVSSSIISFPANAQCINGKAGQWKLRHLTVDQGLSNNFVHGISQDQYGYIWIATSYGLNRFDGITVKKFFHQSNDSTTLNSNYVSVVFNDSQNRLWVGTSNGLMQYNYQLENFTPIQVPDGKHKQEIFSIIEDNNQQLWFGTSSGLFTYDTLKKSLTFINLNALGMQHDSIFCMVSDTNNNLWMSSYQRGLYYYNPKSKIVKQYKHEKSKPNSLSDNWIFQLYIDHEEELWVNTYNTGFCKLNKSDSTFTRYMINPNDEFTKRIRTIFEDIDNRLFIGSRDGLYLFNRKTGKSELYAHTDHEVSILSQNSVTYSFIDNMGSVWLGTHSGGVSYINMYEKPFVHFKYIPNNNEFLNTGSVHCFDETNDLLYIGTEKGINILHKDNGTFTYLEHDINDPNSITYNDVKAIAIQSPDSVWVATNRGGLNLLNKQNKVVKLIKKNDKKGLPSDNLYNVDLDHQNQLWVISNNDWDRLSTVLSRYNSKTDRFISYNHDFFMCLYPVGEKLYVGGSYGFFEYDYKNDVFIEYRDSNLIYRTMTLFKDKTGNMWLGNNNGLVKYDFEKGEFINIAFELGLHIEEVYGIIEKDSILWASTNNGLYKFSEIYGEPKHIKYNHYNTNDGLQSREFNYNAYFKSEDGNIYIGGDNGFNAFTPELITNNPFKPKVVVSEVSIDDKMVKPKINWKGSLVLDKSILLSQKIEIPYNTGALSFKIDVIHFANPAANKFKYKLKGLDKNWHTSNAQNKKVTYHNIPPGEYELEVLAINADEVENEFPKTLTVNVHPPFWLTIWFKIISLLLIGFTIIFYQKIRSRTLRLQKAKLQTIVKNRTKELEDHKLHLEEMVLSRTKAFENEKFKAQESDRLKSAFLANMSHEIRTPMNAILGFIELLNSASQNEEDSISKENTVKFYEIIMSNAHTLLKLMDNMIDLSKIEAGQLEVDLKQVYLPDLLNEITCIFTREVDESNKANNQTVNLIEINQVDNIDILIFTDEVRLKQVLLNLLSNAIKFTHKGKIQYGIKQVEVDKITFYVKDTGIGIAPKEHQNIFKRFRKLEHTTEKLYRGGGVGLSISKFIIEKLGGSIGVSSEPGNGSEFYFSITNHNIKGSIVTNTEELVTLNTETPDWHEKTVLIVEDEDSNIELLKTILNPSKVNLILASNGNEGVEKYTHSKDKIDLILMDIQLPEMSGIDASLHIKKISAKVPIIAQSAYAFPDEIENIKKANIDDYISKPMTKEKVIGVMKKYLK